MKPSFALNLTEDGVTLLHRTARGWMDVGHASFSDPDLPAALDYMRSTAMGLSPKGIAAKLVIPNSQILYTRVTAPGPTDAERRAQIATALEGRTPYDVADLVFDWSGDGPDLLVAVVARETLAEAEAFATEHRFNPVSFVALPDGEFGTEPFFGTSSAAASLLPDGQTVERDAELIRIVSRDLPKAEPTPQKPEADGPPAAKAPEPAPTSQGAQAAAPELADTQPGVPPEPMPMPQPAPEPPAHAAQAAPSKTPEPESPAPETRAPEPAKAENQPSSDHAAPTAAPTEHPVPPAPAVEEAPPKTVPPAPAAKESPAPADAPAKPAPKMEPAPAPAAATAGTPAPKTGAPAEPDEAPMALDVAPEDDIPPMPAHLRNRITAPQSPAADDDLPPAPSAAAQMAFASRRSADVPPPRRAAPQADARSGEARTGETRGATPAKPVGDVGNRAAPAKAPAVERPPTAKPAPKFSYDDPVPAPPRMPGEPPAAPVAAAPKAGKTLKSLGALVTSPEIPGTKVKRPKLAKPVSAAPINPADSTTTEVNPTSLGQGLGARRPAQRGKPRFLGLILTGVLLLILAVVAAWSSLYLTRVSDDTQIQTAGTMDGPPPPAPGEPVVAPDALAPQTVDTGLPSIEDEAAADGQDLALDDPQAEAGPPPTDLSASDTATVPESVAATSGSESAGPPPATGVESDAATAAAPNVAEQDEIFLAGMDTPPTATDPLTLSPPASTGDLVPEAPMPPPPFGTVYQFDANGRIVPTAEGIVTPEGVTLVAGPPSPLPPPRPERVTAAAAALAPPATPAPITEDVAGSADPADAASASGARAPDGISPAETFAADPALADSRPRGRPEGLAPAAPAAGEDDASLAPAEDSRFASLRPRLRPEAVLAAGEASRRAAEAASLAAQASLAAAAEAAVAEANADGSLSPLAVSVSRVPAPRPRDLSRAVEAAVAAATQPAARSAPSGSGSSATDEGDAEPEPVSAAPRIPTKANVAKQATYVNAINLSKVNLIGVYGTQSQRYALVRQANGRYRKVQVGDRFDGGTVKAITAGEVRYQKGGRLLSLTMPQG